MGFFSLLLALLLVHLTFAYNYAPSDSPSDSPPAFTNGFQNAQIRPSSGGKGICVSGLINVPVTATNTKILIEEPANQTVATEIFLEMLQAGPTILKSADGGNLPVSKSYSIAGTLCLPASNPHNVSTLHMLTHGVTLSQGYWEIPGDSYSYIDAATARGRATFSYDRLGIGASEHPDPIQEVQTAVQVKILHSLTQMLREGKIGDRIWHNVAGVGHSFGSFLSVLNVAEYPHDFDALILTGMSLNTTYLQVLLSAFTLQIANTKDDGRFENLSSGYLIEGSSEAVQFGFFRFPFFEQKVFDAQFNRLQTLTIGELFSLSGGGPTLLGPNSAFRGPVDVVLGMYDYPCCGSDCLFPQDLSAAVQPVLFPNADVRKSKHTVVAKSGHNINAHFGAQNAFSQINDFLQDAGF